MMRKLCMEFVAFLVIVATILGGCMRNAETKMPVTGQDTRMLPDMEISCTYTKLMELLETKPSASRLREKAGMAYLKASGEFYYSAVMTDQGLVYLLFDAGQGYISHRNFTLSSEASAASMERLEPGMDLEDVKAADPDGDYSFLYASWTDYPRISHHYLPDGNCYQIQYDNANVILYITHFTL